ncbi:MAG: hypothetical protein IKJ07_00380 [Clostridia bacterium]|nr:hypothetical protein [Clostridia bacterium]
MKNTKSLFKIMAALMSLALMLGAIFTLGAVSVGATSADTTPVDETEEQERETIPVPEIPAIDRPYKTIEELGIDFESIDAYFPRQIEIRYEGGKVYVEDFGASSVEIYDSGISNYVSLELIDGYWTAELSAAPTIVHIYSYETSTHDRLLNVAYYEDGSRDHYVRLIDYVIGVEVSFAVEYGTVTVLYQKGNCYYEDRYDDGVFDTHGVSNREDPEGINDVLFGVDGKIRYCTIYTDGYYHYFPGQGWSSNWEKFVACDAPTGYETVDETYFTANKISLICTEAKGDDIVHDMSTAYCTTPSTCKNGCGYTVGEIEHHDWHLVDGKKECSLCDAVFFPNFEFIDRTYNNLEESGFPYDEIKALFPEVLTVKYEDGKYMVKDVGADKAKAYNNVDYKDIELSLVDGWWVCELDEEIYNDESITLFVYFEGEIDGIYWNITYINGKADSNLYLFSGRDDLSVSVYYDDYDLFTSTYYVGDRLYRDEYKNGALDSQEGSLYVGEDHVYIEYLADGSFVRAYIYIDYEWHYYYPGRGWEKGGELIDPPAGYENADVAYFESILPTTINCAHGNIKAADCESPEYCLTCGIVSEGSEPLGHDMADATCTDPATCKRGCGHTEGEALGHDMADATCTTPATCNTCGHTEGEALGHDMADATCTTPAICKTCGHTEGEALGHDMADATCTVPETCKTCGHTEGEALGHDWIDATYEAPKTCSVCGATEGEALPAESNTNGDNTETDESNTVTNKNDNDTEEKTEGSNSKPSGDSSDTQTDKSGEESKGCGSSIGIGAVAIVTVFGAALVFKKKEK